MTRFHVGQLVAATASEHIVGVNAMWGGPVSLASSSQHEVFDADGISLIASALVVSAQVGVNAASRISALGGSRVLVIGDGIIGASGRLPRSRAATRSCSSAGTRSASSVSAIMGCAPSTVLATTSRVSRIGNRYLPLTQCTATFRSATTSTRFSNERD
jgi:hypothetical protein